MLIKNYFMPKPLNNNVLLERFSIEAVTPSGIVYSKGGDPIHYGRVLDASASLEKDFSPGDVVGFSPSRAFPVGAGNNIIIDHEYIVIKCSIQ